MRRTALGKDTRRGDSSYTLFVFHDVTRQKGLEKMRTEFIANLSHELRTPVTNIKGYAETLLDAGEDLSDTTARFVGVIARNAGRLEAIIEDLLALAGLERQAEDASIHMEDASAARILSLVVDQFEQAAVDGDIRLSTDVDPELEIVGGVHLIEQALEQTQWNKNRAAGLLGLNRTTLIEKIKKRRISRDG